MFSYSLAASAQGGTGATSASSAGSTSASSTAPAGVDGYRIAGEARPAEPSKAYEYTREMPDGSDGVYWHIEGATAINDGPPQLYPDGSLDANEHASLAIQWDLATKDSLVLQLRRNDPESKTGVVVLASLFGPWPATCTGHINYYGPTTNPAPSGVHNDQSLCPSPPIGQFTPLPTYWFNFDTPDCDYFIWTLKYNTANGTYQEQWSTSISRQSARFVLYPQIPASLHAVNPAPLDPLTGQPFPNWFSICNPSNAGPLSLAGQSVLSIDVQCTGYRGILCNISDEMHVYFTGVLGNIGAISTTAGSGPYCRDQPIALTTSVPQGATGNTRYIWTVFAGSVANPVTTTTNSVALDVSWVAPTGNSIRVEVQATDNSCGGNAPVSNTQSIALQLAAAAPQPQNMLLNNGLCAGISPKVVSVDGAIVNFTSDYEWSISGLGATFFGGGNTPVRGKPNNISIVTPNAVPVIVTARRLITCGGFGPALSTTYQIVSPTPVAPTGAALTWCFSNPRIIELVNVQPGLNYFYNAYSIMPAGSNVTFTGGINGIGAIVQVTPDANGVFPTQFFLVVTVTSPCSSVPITFGTMLYLPKKQMPCIITGPRASAPPVLYPNPTTGQVVIAAEPAITYAWAKVMNAQGQLMQEQKATDERSVTSLDVSALPTGIYLVQLFDGQHLTTQRLVKE